MTEHTCPHCKQPIYDDEALLCHFCGESLGRQSSGMLGKVSAPKWLFVITALIVAVSFAVLVLR